MKKKQIVTPKLSAGTELIDTHCHLDMAPYSSELSATVSTAADKGVTGIITIGIDLKSSRKAVAIAQQFPRVWATIGVHPHNAASENITSVYEELSQLAKDKRNKVVGYGEIGLDFAKNYAPREVQLDCFEKQIELAQALKLPIIIHDREAHAETLEILKRFAPFPAGGVMHCFSGDTKLARKIIDLGLYISIPGIVTFKNSADLQQVACDIPLDKILLETDGPFLAPVPYRGKKNRPEYLLHTAQKIAELRDISIDEVARQTTDNARVLFNLDQHGTGE